MAVEMLYNFGTILGSIMEDLGCHPSLTFPTGGFHLRLQRELASSVMLNLVAQLSAEFTPKDGKLLLVHSLH